jgi:hypothetical protein
VCFEVSPRVVEESARGRAFVEAIESRLAGCPRQRPDGAEAMRAASARESGGTLRLARGVVLHSRLYLGWMRAAVESIAGAIYAQGSA